jgi:hypothetical protein
MNLGDISAMNVSLGNRIHSLKAMIGTAAHWGG